MKNFLSILLLALLVSSCNFFETEKVSSDRFYEEEIENIDWNAVDSYPVFQECAGFTEKEDQKKCFERVLSNHLYASIYSRNLSVHTKLQDTVPVSFTISAEGLVVVSKVIVDSTVLRQLPLMETWIRESIDSLPKLTPATKQGIPVRTQFSLPVVLHTEDL